MAEKNNKKLNYLHVRIENSLLSRIKAAAKKMYDTPVSKFVRQALIKYCEKIEQEKE